MMQLLGIGTIGGRLRLRVAASKWTPPDRQGRANVVEVRGDGIYEAHVEQVGDGHICHRHHRRCVCKTKLSVVKFSRLNAKKCIFYTFWAICCNFWVFFLNFGCKILGFKNSACVKEITNMRYDQIYKKLDVFQLEASGLLTSSFTPLKIGNFF